MSLRRDILNEIEKLIPIGVGKENDSNSYETWDELYYLGTAETEWLNDKLIDTIENQMKSLGSGNHFVEIQKSINQPESFIYIMIHSGSRRFGYEINRYYHNLALKMNKKYFSPSRNNDIAFFPTDSSEGQEYIYWMNFALSYAHENRQKMLRSVQNVLSLKFPEIKFEDEINIHHNYAALENHFGKNVWVHRKGAISAKNGEKGIIPGSMGHPSYLVSGCGNKDSFMSSSHGAGRPRSRTASNKILTQEQCNKDMEGIVYNRWRKIKRGKMKNRLDLSEAPGAYKDIKDVMDNQKDLTNPIVELLPLIVLKG